MTVDTRAFTLTAGSVLITKGEHCPACQRPFRVGDVCTLVVLGPGDDPEARDRCRAGRPFTGIALSAHRACITGETP